MKTRTKEVKAPQTVEIQPEVEVVEMAKEVPTEPMNDGSDDGGNGNEPTTDLARARARELRPWQQRFLESLQKAPNVGLACRIANVSRVTAYRSRDDNELFRELWDEALESVTDEVEHALYDVAVNGHERTQYSKDGEVRGVERVRDVNAMKFFLSGNRPKTYRETHGPLVNINVGQAEEALTAALQSGTLERFFGRKLTEKADSPQ
jgi:hypothetical protein